MNDFVKKYGQRPAYNEGLSYVERFADPEKKAKLVSKIEEAEKITRKDFFTALDSDGDKELTVKDDFHKGFAQTDLEEYINRHFPKLIDQAGDQVVMDLIGSGGTIDSMFGGVNGVGFRRYQMVKDVGPLEKGDFGFFEFDVTLKDGSTRYVRIKASAYGTEKKAQKESLAELEYQKFLMDVSQTVTFNTKDVYEQMSILLEQFEPRATQAGESRKETHAIGKAESYALAGTSAATVYLAADLAGLGWLSGKNPLHVLQEFVRLSERVDALERALSANEAVAGEGGKARGKAAKAAAEANQAAAQAERVRIQGQLGDVRGQMKALQPEVDKIAKRVGIPKIANPAQSHAHETRSYNAHEIKDGIQKKRGVFRNRGSFRNRVRANGTTRRGLATKGMRLGLVFDAILISSIGWKTYKMHTDPLTPAEELMVNFEPLFADMSFEEFDEMLGDPANVELQARVRIMWWYLQKNKEDGVAQLEDVIRVTDTLDDIDENLEAAAEAMRRMQIQMMQQEIEPLLEAAEKHSQKDKTLK